MFDVGEILKLVGCKKFARNFLELNGTPDSQATAWELTSKLSEGILSVWVIFREKCFRHQDLKW